MRLCFDLDGTLCIGFPYETAQPMPGAAELLMRLKKAGHTIIIMTARGMRTHGSNPGAARADIGLLTMQQLKDWGFVYDEIYFGKPNADLFIDDKSYIPGKAVGSRTKRVLSCEQMEIDLGDLL